MADVHKRLTVMVYKKKGISTSDYSTFAVLKKVVLSYHQPTGGADAAVVCMGNIRGLGPHWYTHTNRQYVYCVYHWLHQHVTIDTLSPLPPRLNFPAMKLQNLNSNVHFIHRVLSPR